MKQRTVLLTAGGVGGAVGSLSAELVPFSADSEVSVVLEVAAWAAVLSGLIAVALRWAMAHGARHRWPSVAQVAAALLAGIIAGGVGGGISQHVFSYFDDGWFKHFVGRVLCWGIMGAGLGLCLSFGIPNLRKWSGAAWGGAGGLLGGAVFLGLGYFDLPDVISRLAGGTSIGTLVAAGIVVAERVELARSGTLEVTYGPREVIKLVLGQTPITFGGSSKDTIYVMGFDQAALSVSVRNGVVVARQSAGKEVALKDGSSIQIGTISMKVRSS
jgi:hypothetical protein